MYSIFFKRFLDLFGALLLSIILFPLFIIICLALFLKVKGTPFFRQKRPGKNEKIFSVYKFKSMTDEKDNNGNLLPDDKRITKIGAFLRKTSLDEIPQLLNVIKGDMSFIGPRPLLIKYLPYYSKEEKLRHTVRPGITGLAQVNGRNFIEWEDKLSLDVYYVKNISFLLDLKIAIKTIIKVIKASDVAVATNKVTIDFDVHRKKQQETT
jgi:lipopolysaccharide/colanic/teichoic acid biosynthesis glycosyltransferase